jgi:RHS repeat-associated protein
LLVDYDYDPAGRLSKKTLGNGVYSTYAYDAAGHITSLVNLRADAVVLSRYEYTYDLSGRRTSMITLDGTFSYGYDALGQLIRVEHPDGRIAVYDYDAAGNRTRVIDNGVETAYATNDLNQYTEVGDVTYEFDADGNLVSQAEGGVTTTYTYDIENRLIGVDSPDGLWAYRYDALGNRVGVTANGAATTYVIDPTGLGNVAAEYDGAGAVVARYDHGYGLLSRTDGIEAAFYTFQAIGHTSELTGADGVVLNSYAYDPWGVSLGKSETMANPFEYVGEYGVMNEGNGLTSMRERPYEAHLARFTSADPIGVAGGANLYGYTRNGPVSFIHPTGMEPILGPWKSVADDGRISVSPDGTVVRVQRRLEEPSRMDERWARYDREFNRWIDNELFMLNLRQDAIDRRLEWEYEIAKTAGESTIIALSIVLHPVLAPWVINTLHATSIPNIMHLLHVFWSSLPRASDPNDKLAPAGYGDDGHLQPDSTIAYTLRFENQPEATGPAREVVITDVLDPNLDLDTFELTQITFGNVTLTVPPGQSHYESVVPMTANGEAIQIEVSATLDKATRTLTFTLNAIDPSTGWGPENPLTGLLYPEDGPAAARVPSATW